MQILGYLIDALTFAMPIGRFEVSQRISFYAEWLSILLPLLVGTRADSLSIYGDFNSAIISF